MGLEDDVSIGLDAGDQQQKAVTIVTSTDQAQAEAVQVVIEVHVEVGACLEVPTVSAVRAGDPGEIVEAVVPPVADFFAYVDCCSHRFLNRFYEVIGLLLAKRVARNPEGISFLQIQRSLLGKVKLAQNEEAHVMDHLGREFKAIGMRLIRSGGLYTLKWDNSAKGKEIRTILQTMGEKGVSTFSNKKSLIEWGEIFAARLRTCPMAEVSERAESSDYSGLACMPVKILPHDDADYRHVAAFFNLNEYEVLVLSRGGLAKMDKRFL